MVGLLGAVAGSVWPPAILLAALVAIAFVLAVPFAWRRLRPIVRTAALALLGAVVSVLLLAPWSCSLIGADAATLGLHVRAPLSFADVLRFDVGPARPGWFTLGLVVAARRAARDRERARARVGDAGVGAGARRRSRSRGCRRGSRRPRRCPRPQGVLVPPRSGSRSRPGSA